MHESPEMLAPDAPRRGPGIPPDAPAPVPLDGYFERRGFSPMWTTCAVLIGAFVLFQVIVTPLALAALLVMQGIGMEAMSGDMSRLVAEHADIVLLANTIGQALGLCLPAWWLARMHSRRPLAFLRVRRFDPSFVLPASAAFIALLPVAQWLSAANGAIPLPEFIREFEATQMELIRQALRFDASLTFQLTVLALTPALCEEALFRGYVQRQAERSLGALGGVLFSGVVFAMYHLRFSQVLPLAALGAFMAYLVWRTGSIWPAVGVHFANNAVAVAMGAYAARRPELDVADLEQISVPWYLVVSGAFLFVFCIWAIERRASARGGAAVSETLPGFLRE